MRLNRRSSGAITALVATILVATVAGCSSSDDTGSSSDTTTGTVGRSTTTTTTEPVSPSTSAGTTSTTPGLWLATPAGITDEKGTVWAKPKDGETLRAPLDDAMGGVVYLRCVGETPTCAIEDATVRDQVPLSLGPADGLLAVGTAHERRVLITSWTDPSIVPSFEENRSSLVARLVDMENGQVTPLAGWFGWESGPFAADVENDQFAGCFGEGETCGFGLATGPDQVAPVDGIEPATVTSLALDPEGKQLTWVEAAPMSGAVDVKSMTLPAGNPTSVQIQGDEAPAADDAVTDGSWVAIRVGTSVSFHHLTGDPGDTTLTVAGGVTEMAIRELGGGGGADSVL